MSTRSEKLWRKATRCWDRADELRAKGAALSQDAYDTAIEDGESVGDDGLRDGFRGNTSSGKAGPYERQ